jgi:hypothetical protein
VLLAPPEVVPAVVGVAAEGEPELGPALALLDEDDGAAALAALVVVVLEVVRVVDAATVGGALFVGTVSVGAPAVFATVDPPPPQAETPTASPTPAERAARELVRRVRRIDTDGALDPEWVHATPAVRAIVQVLLGELVAPIAEAEILDRPRELRRRRGQRQQDGDGLQGLAGLPVHVNPVRLGLDYHLSARGGRPQPILLIRPHQFDPTSEGILPRVWPSAPGVMPPRHITASAWDRVPPSRHGQPCS